MEATQFKAYVAIDIGTSFSGVALKIGDRIVKSDPFKQPTLLRMKRNNDRWEIHSFGKNAHSHVEGTYVFQFFKPALYEKDGVLKKNPEVHSICKKVSMKSTEAFGYVIQALTDEHLTDWLKREKIEPEDLCCVLTVPPSWSDGAREIMLQAIIKNKIVKKSDQVFIESKPICTAFWFLAELPNMPAFKDKDIKGSNILVVDCGGGTVDFTCLEIISLNSVKKKNC